MGAFKEPHGGELKNLYLPAGKVADEKRRSRDLPSWDLTMRQLCDIELLLNGGFSPLDGFQSEQDYRSVLEKMRLSNGTVWPMPITLDVTEAFAQSLKVGDNVALRDAEGVLIATMELSSIYRPDKAAEAKAVFGTTDDSHPGVHYLLTRANPVYLGGRLTGFEAPTHYDFKHLRDTPREIRDRFQKLGWRRVVAFQTRNPMHRAHLELTFRAAKDVEANLLIHPVVGMTKPGALIRKNYGCTHFIVGRDHAGPGNNKQGKPFYGPYDAQELMRSLESELDITMVPFKNMVYVEDRAQYFPEDEVGKDVRTLDISGTELRRRLREGLDIPEWFSFPEVVAELRRTHPPRYRQGFTVFFTGLSGSGKSTIANALMVKLMEMGGRPVTLLDGDVVRKHLSSELGFSKEHRDLNIQRIGYVASEITKNGGIAICAPIAPYAKTRRLVREMIEPNGGFIEIHVSTPIAVCEARDRKGLYAKARAGLIKGFTGIDDPYEAPENAEMVVDTSELTPDIIAHRIIVKLESLGFIR
jgi:sulfate adenylyltransferase